MKETEPFSRTLCLEIKNTAMAARVVQPHQAAESKEWKNERNLIFCA